jgi:murein DD-endopeptidase MepM/ murein hydrolase activator NlpD
MTLFQFVMTAGRRAILVPDTGPPNPAKRVETGGGVPHPRMQWARVVTPPERNAPESITPGGTHPLLSSPTAAASVRFPDSRMSLVSVAPGLDSVQVLSPFAAARPTRLSRLVILCVLLSASVSPVSSTVPASAQAAAGATTSWGWPLPVPHPIVGPFIAPASAYAAGHRGIDISSPEGTLVTAPADGVVYFAGVVVDRPVLSIRHADGVVSSYEPVESVVSVGTAVRRGDTVGRLLAGHCALGCIHFGVRLFGEYVSPLNYLGGIPRSVLLPTRPLSPAP